VSYPVEKILTFLPIVQAIGRMSKDRSTKVGAIAVDDDLVIRSSGWNDLPRGINSTDERRVRPGKLIWTAHAEENLVAQAARTGASLKGCTLIVTALHPCSTCARLIIQSGIRRVFAPTSDNERWREESGIAGQMFYEAGIEVCFYSPTQEQA
jgi:dCMP deaminase